MTEQPNNDQRKLYAPPSPAALTTYVSAAVVIFFAGLNVSYFREMDALRTEIQALREQQTALRERQDTLTESFDRQQQAALAVQNAFLYGGRPFGTAAAAPAAPALQLPEMSPEAGLPVVPRKPTVPEAVPAAPDLPPSSANISGTPGAEADRASAQAGWIRPAAGETNPADLSPADPAAPADPVVTDLPRASAPAVREPAPVPAAPAATEAPTVPAGRPPRVAADGPDPIAGEWAGAATPPAPLPVEKPAEAEPVATDAPAASILATNPDQRRVIISIGLSSGIQGGRKFHIYRQGTWVGDVRVAKVFSDMSMCDIITPTPRGIRVGDVAQAVAD